jgi:molybdopterin synthase sulfur carrier subunit
MTATAAEPKHLDIRYFAAIREALGVDREPWVTTASTLAELRRELAARSVLHAQALAPSRPVRFAVNQVLSPEAAELPSGGRVEVAVFPPVTGG